MFGEQKCTDLVSLAALCYEKGNFDSDDLN